MPLQCTLHQNLSSTTCSRPWTQTSAKTAKLYVIQNDLMRMQAGHSRKDHTNMKNLRESKRIMSVNQISCYHVGIEMFNIIYNASSQSLQEDMKIQERGYSLRNMKDSQVRVPNKGKKHAHTQGQSFGITYQVTSEQLKRETSLNKNSKIGFGQIFLQSDLKSYCC